MLYSLHCLRFVLIDILDILHVLVQASRPITRVVCTDIDSMRCVLCFNTREN